MDAPRYGLGVHAAIAAAGIAIASTIAGCGSPYGGCDMGDGGGGAAAPLAVGEDRDGAFWPLSAGDDASLVFGSQGGWMVLAIIALPPEWRDEDCVELIVDGRVGALEIQPIAVRFEPAREPAPEGNVVRYGPIPFFLSEDVALLEGRTLDLRARAFSAQGRADLALPIALRRP